MCEDILKFILAILFVVPIFSQSSLNIKLRVIDKGTSSGRPNTNFVIKENGGYYTTDANGEVNAVVPAQGIYTFRVTVGTEIEVKKKEVSYDNQIIILFVGDINSSTEQTNAKGGITIRGERDKTKLSRYTLQQEEIKRLPGAQGDSLKAILTLPGVSPGIPVGLSTTASLIPAGFAGPYSNSDRGDIVLRGAGTRANQYYFDGFPISYPFHLGNQSSVLNNNIIKSFDVYTGAYSTRYGYATGGIINIEGKNEVKKTQTIVNLNLFLTDAQFETKLSEKSFAIVAARKNYPNLVLLRFYPEAIPQNAKYADYQDYQFKYGYGGDKHKVNVVLFGSRDRQAYTRTQAEFENTGSGNPDNRPPVGLDKGFHTEGFRYIYQAGSKFSNTLNLSRNSFKEFFELKITNPATAENIFGIQNVTSQNLYYVENIQNFEIIKNIFRIETGQNYRERGITLKGENITQQNSQFSNVFNNLLDSSPTFRALIDGDGVKSKEYGAYIEGNLEYKGFKLNPGVRWDYYNLADQKTLSPRITSSYTIEKTGTTFIAGAGIHRNSPTGIEQISERVGNSKLLMEKAEHLAIGINQEFWKDWLFKVEGFRNIFSDLVVPDTYAQNPYALNNQPRDILQRTESVRRNILTTKSINYTNRGDGFSEGVEFYLKKSARPEANGFFGWISYANSITKRNNHQTRLTTDERNNRNALNNSRKLLYQTEVGNNYINYYDDNKFEFLYDNDRQELYDLDRTHVLNMVFGWKWSKEWQIGGRYRYFTNTPITPIVGSNRIDQAATFGVNLNTAKYSENFNSERLPSFHQFDIRIDRFINYDWGLANVYLEIINFYGRRNISGQNFVATKPFIPGNNPEPTFDNLNSPYIQTPLQGGRLAYLPLLNFGLEVRF
jgi:hypothetical protein